MGNRLFFRSFAVPFAVAGVSWAISFQVSVENTFTPCGKAMGLDVVEYEVGSETLLLGANNTDDVIYWYTPSGSVVDTTYLADTNSSCFGVAVRPGDQRIHTNDWSEEEIFHTDDGGVTWDTVTNPAGTGGRGMVFNGDECWATNGYSGLLVFQPGSSPSQSLSLPEIYEQLSGITLFSLDDQLGVALTTYSDKRIWFYGWNGTELTFLDDVPCPAECQASYGLAWSEYRDSFFWSCRTQSGDFFVHELSWEVSQSLEQNSWAGIKGSFGVSPVPAHPGSSVSPFLNR